MAQISEQVSDTGERRLLRRLRLVLAGIALAAVWWAIYGRRAPAAHWLTYRAFGLADGTRFAGAVEFFVFETPKVLMLLVLVVFGVGIVRSYFTPERTRAILAGKRESVGNVLAFMMSVIGLSFPEAIILRKVLKLPLIFAFFGVVKVAGKVPGLEDVKKLLS